MRKNTITNKTKQWHLVQHNCTINGCVSHNLAWPRDNSSHALINHSCVPCVHTTLVISSSTHEPSTSSLSAAMTAIRRRSCSHAARRLSWHLAWEKEGSYHLAWEQWSPLGMVRPACIAPVRAEGPLGAPCQSPCQSDVGGDVAAALAEGRRRLL